MDAGEYDVVGVRFSPGAVGMVADAWIVELRHGGSGAGVELVGREDERGSDGSLVWRCSNAPVCGRLAWACDRLVGMLRGDGRLVALRWEPGEVGAWELPDAADAARFVDAATLVHRGGSRMDGPLLEAPDDGRDAEWWARGTVLEREAAAAAAGREEALLAARSVARSIVAQAGELDYCSQPLSALERSGVELAQMVLELGS
jgi:hypothetical protein